MCIDVLLTDDNMLTGRRDRRDDADLLDEGGALLRDGQVAPPIS